MSKNQSEFKPKEYNLAQKISLLSESVKNILQISGRLADDLGMPIYVVGGFPRDLILCRDNLDIDLVVEGDGIAFARKLGVQLNAEVFIHEKFYTAVLVVSGSFSIDVVTARSEYYEHPAALPTVIKGTIKDDLLRRDFTVNSIAIRLNERYFGNVLDLFGGQEDIHCKIIRILHDLSFIDDPTRMFRAVRFEQRYGFGLEPKTEQLALDAIKSGVLAKLSRERISFELFLILGEKNAAAMVARLDGMGLLKSVYPEINVDAKIKTMLAACKDEQEIFLEMLGITQELDSVLVCLLVLHYNLDTPLVLESAERMRIPKHYRDEILLFIGTIKTISGILEDTKELSKYTVYKSLQDASFETLFTITLLSDSKVLKDRIIFYIKNLRVMEIKLTGNDLKELGIPPGPMYKNILEEVLKAKIEGLVTTFDDEMKYVKELIKKGL